MKNKKLEKLIKEGYKFKKHSTDLKGCDIYYNFKNHHYVVYDNARKRVILEYYQIRRNNGNK